MGDGPKLRVGGLARDTFKNKVGRVMELGQELVYLRPEKGGLEWTVMRDKIEPVSTREQLSPRVAELNAQSEVRR